MDHVPLIAAPRPLSKLKLVGVVFLTSLVWSLLLYTWFGAPLVTAFVSTRDQPENFAFVALLLYFCTFVLKLLLAGCMQCNSRIIQWRGDEPIYVDPYWAVRFSIFDALYYLLVFLTGRLLLPSIQSGFVLITGLAPNVVLAGLHALQVYTTKDLDREGRGCVVEPV